METGLHETKSGFLTSMPIIFLTNFSFHPGYNKKFSCSILHIFVPEDCFLLFFFVPKDSADRDDKRKPLILVCTISEVHLKDSLVIIWASSRENLSSRFLEKRVSNKSPQLQSLARKLKFHM